jgi:NitT/TauT family transport system permease protein
MNGWAARARNWIGPALVFCLFILAWYLIAYTLPRNFAPTTNKPLIIPPPHRLFEDMSDTIWGRLVTATWISTKTALSGLAISMATGISLGILMSRRLWLERALWPYLIALQVTPIIALVPLIIKLVGANFGARVLVTVIITFFPIVSNTLFGFRGVPGVMHDLFRMMNASPRQRLFRLEFPAASPAIFAGFRIAAGLAVIGAIVGDFFFARGEPGLGKLINLFFLNNQSGPMFITAMAASLLGFMLFATFGLLTRWVVGRWYDEPTSR